MKKIRKIILTTFFSVMLGFTGVFLASCGAAQIDAKISASEEEFDIEVGKEKSVSFNVTDFVYDGSVSLSIFDSVVSGGSKGHISYEVDYVGGGVTNVKVVGISGGTSTLVATTKEGGNKTASIKINVKGYSDDLTPKNQKMFISPQTDLNPSANDFIFSDNTTEKKLRFYFVLNKDKVSTKEILYGPTLVEYQYSFPQEGGESLDAKEFQSAKLNKETKTITFTQSSIDVHGEKTTFTKTVKDTEVNYFIAEYENLTTGKVIYRVVDFTTLLGIDSDVFEVCDEDGNAKDKSKLIVYSTETLGRDYLKVKVPYFSTGTIAYDFNLDESKISLIPLGSSDGTGSREYVYQLVSKIAYKTTAKINFNIYYKGFLGVADESVSITKSLDVEILVEPKEITVNDVKDSEGLEYVFYNSSVGDYGWKEFKLNVLAEDSSYTGILLNFNSSLIDVKQGVENLWSDRVITDLSTPIMIRGKNSAETGSGTDDYKINLTLQSDVFEISGHYVTYTIPFEIKAGATKLSFEKDEYNYSTTSPDYGIFVSTKEDEIEFSGIYANEDFEKAFIEYQDEERFADIQYIGKQQNGDKHNLILKVKPIKTGNQTVRIILDNGRAILATFRVVKTFDDVSIYQNTSSQRDNNGTILVESQEGGLRAIVRNGYLKDGERQYGKALSIQINTSNGLEVVKEILFESESVPGTEVFNVEKNGDGVTGDYTLKTTTRGTESIRFKVLGIDVENFILTTSEKDVVVKLIAYNPIDNLQIKDNDGKLASNVSVYADENAGDLQSTSLNIFVGEGNAYNFFEYLDDQSESYDYFEESYNDKFVYWTSNQKVFTTANVLVDRMVYGREYLIGSSISDIWATFNTTTRTLTARSGKTEKSFMLFANIRQYQLTKSFAISVETKEYKTVNMLEEIINEAYYVKNEATNKKEIILKQGREEISFTVNVNPKEATNLNIKALVSDPYETKILKEAPEISPISKGSWLVTLKLNPDVLDTAAKVGCELKIAAEDWVNSSGVIKSEYEAKALKYEISFVNGSESNPYYLTKAEDILAIGKSVNGMSSHYRLLNTIDMSAAAASNKLPLGADITTLEGGGVFVGSIVGVGNAKITGLNLTGAPGLFKTIGKDAKIENVTFEGSINIHSSASGNYGLVAGENRGTLKNIAVNLNISDVGLTSGSKLGGVVGVNRGSIIKEYTSDSTPMTTLYMNGMLRVSIIGDNVLVGGIAGLNTGVIADQTTENNKKALKFGFSNYMAYSFIAVSSDYESYIGAVSGDNQGYIYGLLVGGLVESDSENAFVGGVTGKLTGSSKVGKTDKGAASQVTIRTKVQGYTVGLVTGYKPNAEGEIDNILIEAIDDGTSTNQNASMIVKLISDADDVEYIEEELESLQAYINTLDPVADADEIAEKEGKIADDETQLSAAQGRIADYLDPTTIIAGRKNAFTFNNETMFLFTYVSRERKTLENEFDGKTDNYFGDYLIYNPSTGNKLGQVYFEAKNAEGSSVAVNEGFVEFKVDGDPSAPKMFMAYYFEAESYILNGSASTVNLDEIQLDLDRELNQFRIGDKLCPFNINEGLFTITSESPLVVIDTMGVFHIKGTGVAKLVITSTLNARLNEVIYLNIVNYFNNKVSSTQSFFKNGDTRLSASGENNYSIFPNSNTIFEVQPVLMTYYQDLKNGEQNNKYIYEDGTIVIANKTINLVRNKDLTVKVEPDNKTEFEKHAVYEVSNDRIIFSKIAGAQTSAVTVDDVKLIASFNAKVGDKSYVYTYNLGTEESPIYTTITFRYLQGLTKINKNYDSLVVTNSKAATETISFVSDSTEDLNIEIYDEQGKQVNDLFNVVITPSGDFKWNVSISLNKDSTLYNESCFGNYEIKYTGTTNRDKVYQTVPLTLIDDNLEGVVIDNYTDIEKAYTSDKIIPGKYGYLSVIISPKDLGFSSFEIVNNDVNYSQDSTSANFEFGYYDAGGKKFSPISATVINNGISISRQTLLSNANFDGQFFIRYLFANNSSVKDGATVSLTATLRLPNAEDYVVSLDYTVYKKFVFDVTIDGKDRIQSESEPNYYVARGVSYKLNIENTGYDANSIVITTSNNTLASVEKDGGDYYLVINGRETSETIQLIASASRVDADGNMFTATSNSNCKIMDYVINWQAQGYDIVSGVEDGNIAVALGQRKTLSVDFGNGKYIEYNSTIPGITEKLQDLYSQASLNGKWSIYSDLKDNKTLIPDDFANISNADKDKFQLDTLSSSKEFDNKYLSVDGFTYWTNLKHDPSKERHYIFTYTAHFVPSGTVYAYAETSTTDSIDVYSQFSLLSYITGDEDHPLPITSYDDLKENMVSGGYYILTKDLIVTPGNFEPITANFAVLDGNGHSIIFEVGDYDISSYQQAGLFTSIERGSVVKNLKVVLGNSGSSLNKNVTFTTTQSTATVFGLIAARNAGSITNARVENGSGSLEVLFSAASSPQSGCVVAGLVGNNSGYITNSQVVASIKTNVSLGGLVGTNSGIVASSYYKDGILTNTSNDNTKFHTAGLVVSNNESGRILTSYTSGHVDNTHIYSYQTNRSKIASTVQAAGFVYENKGSITDSYSNLPLDASASSAGFVYRNSGDIKNCFSTSIILDQYSQNNYYFVAENVIDGARGSFENCYYLKDSGAQYSTGKDTITGINQSLSTESFDGVNALWVTGESVDVGEPEKKNGFDDIAENFSSFAYGSDQGKYNNVWMFIESGSTVTNNAFKKTIITTNSDTGTLSSVEYHDQVFAGGRLELVSANILAFSFEEITGQEVDENGITIYNYSNGRVNESGSILNPYAVSGPEQFENYLTSNGNKTDSKSYFRFVSNIDYREISQITSHKVSFSGIIEGNGMTIQNIAIAGSDVLENAGWLGKIDGGARVSGVMNLTIIPKTVNFPNAICVGTLAGTIKEANIENVNIISSVVSVDTEETNSVTVAGKNFVGGVAGMVYKGTKVQNIVVRVGAKAAHIASEGTTADGVYAENGNKENYSYAGGVFGYVYSTNSVEIKDITYAGRDPYVIGGKAGFIFGGISSNVNASNIDLTINSDMLINAYKFGGLIAGESKGNIDNVKIKGINTISTTKPFAVFSVDNFRPVAVGGVVGLMIGGKISNIYQGQSIYIKDTGRETIGYVGGIVGQVSKLNTNLTATIESVVMDADIYARSIIGGIVGYVENSVTINKVAIKERTFTLQGLLATSYIGGFIGFLEGNATINNSYSWAKIVENCYVINNSITANVSALIAYKTSTATHSLKNIYTTTTYDITLEDKRIDGNAKPVTLEGGVIKVGGEEKINVKYNLSIGSITNDKVFCFVATLEPSTTLNNKDLTNFKVRAGLTEVTLNQNEQGASITEYDNNKTNPKGQATAPAESMLYGIMDSESGWVNPKGIDDKFNALPYLEFETEVMP